MEDRGKINEYTCEAGHVTRTGNVDPGVTPFMIGCKADGCTEMAKSCFYRCDQSRRPDWVWYRPNEAQFEDEYKRACERLERMIGHLFTDEHAKGLRSDMFKHVANGGLSLRRINGSIDLEKLGPQFRTRHG